MPTDTPPRPDEALTVSDAEREILAHSLGLTSGRTKPYRNYFAASHGHADMLTIHALLDKGLMLRGRREPSGMTYFHVTEAGCALLGTTRDEAER